MSKPADVTLPNDREVRVVRTFDAPRELVWDAHTKPELVQRWMEGYPGWTMVVCEMDVRVGGKYRWRWRNDEDGKEFGFFGVFREVERPSKTVHEENFDPGDVGGAMPADKPAIVTTQFSESDGTTTLLMLIQFSSKEARDAAMSTGMTDGMEYSYKDLDSLLDKLRQ